MTPRQYGEKYRDHLLEQYKIWVEIVDRAIQRKEQANRLFITLITALIAASSFAIGSWPDALVEKLIPLMVALIAILGIVLGFAWFVTLQALERQIQAKLATIRKMELALPFPFYSVEISERNKIGRIWDFKLPVPDWLLPLIVIVLFFLLLATAIEDPLSRLIAKFI